jgi:iron complex outermembrane receptor protein
VISLKLTPRPSLLVVLAILLAGAVQAQTTVSGKVIDDQTGEILLGASVFIEGTTEGNTTDLDGNFTFNTSQQPPFDVIVQYVGYQPIKLKFEGKPLRVKMKTSSTVLQAVEVKELRISEKEKEAPTTIEKMDALGIKETAAANFYDGLGNLKGVDLTAASMGFKIINTRGFNSTSPVRSLQLVDGVDNQSPGLNFSIGNFAGANELDVESVELIVGANTALYGPNAFNGVISMNTKDPFKYQGIDVMGKIGERNLRETAIRGARAFKVFGAEHENLAFKVNFSYMEANDWEADNMDPVYDLSRDMAATFPSLEGLPLPEEETSRRDNWGGYDAVNRYGDEVMVGSNTLASQRLYPGLGRYHRTGYSELDLVDYDTENMKISGALHYKWKNDVVLKGVYRYGTGTTVYQGDNRYSLKDLQIHQQVVELSKKDKFFLRAYNTTEDAGKSYDAVFTALLLQDKAKSNSKWSQDYLTYYNQSIVPQVRALDSFPTPIEYFAIPLGSGPNLETYAKALSIMQSFRDSLVGWHELTRMFADSVGYDVGLGVSDPFYIPGTERFDRAFDTITSRLTFGEGGSGFYDQSALSHIQGQYKFEPELKDEKIGEFILGGSFRQYRPDSKGTIFVDTNIRVVRNYEFGIYGSAQKRYANEKLILTASGRVDKNQNYQPIFSPALSVVYRTDPTSSLRFAFTSAIRNPTLADQFLYYNTGRALLVGNVARVSVERDSLHKFNSGPIIPLEVSNGEVLAITRRGWDSLVTVESFRDYNRTFKRDTLNYFNVKPVRPEQVRTIELGYKGVLLKDVFIDVSYYHSWYRYFLGFKIGADITFDSLGLLLPGETQVYRVSANSEDVVTTQGVSLGINYYFWKYYALTGNYTWNALDLKGSTDEIIPAYNTPEHKYNIGINARDLQYKIGPVRLNGLGFNVTYKWIQGFLFEGSPQFTGRIPTYDMLDAQVSYNFKKINTTFKLGASNLMNEQNYQTYGGPQIGRLAYFSVTVDLDRKSSP